jgi:flagellar basal body rod protein FlgG
MTIEQLQTIIGELKITNHNLNKAILSGTFWFDAINSKGEKIQVREGRFDMEY